MGDHIKITVYHKEPVFEPGSPNSYLSSNPER